MKTLLFPIALIAIYFSSLSQSRATLTQWQIFSYELGNYPGTEGPMRIFCSPWILYMQMKTDQTFTVISLRITNGLIILTRILINGMIMI